MVGNRTTYGRTTAIESHEPVAGQSTLPKPSVAQEKDSFSCGLEKFRVIIAWRLS